MDLIVDAQGKAGWGSRSLRCAIGRGGVSEAKREGDGATPAGRFPIRSVYYRADRVARPATVFPVSPLNPKMGWCDDPADGAYNRPVTLPHPARHEVLWRDDRLYDVVAVIGHNDDPVVPGAGSAVFVHVASPDFAPTEGCVALRLDDLLAVLAQADAATAVAVNPPR